jgi:hypothetical protein
MLLPGEVCVIEAISTRNQLLFFFGTVIDVQVLVVVIEVLRRPLLLNVKLCDH